MDQGWLISARNAARSAIAAPIWARGDRRRIVLRATRHSLPFTDPALRKGWQDLARRPAEPNPFHEYDLLSIALTHCDPAHRAEVIAIWSETAGTRELIGLIPLADRAHYGRWPIPVVQNWRHPNAFLGTPLVRAGREEPFWQGLLAYLDRHARLRAFLHLDMVALDGPVHAALERVATRQRRGCDVVRREPRALRAAGLTSEDYYAATVRKKKRKELARLRNRLHETGTIQTVEGLGELTLDEWLDEFLSLEAAGWKGRNDSALASTPDTRALFVQTARALARRRRLHLIAMRRNGRAIAMLVSILAAPGAFSFKTAFDENFARFSPGVLLQIDNLAMTDRHGLAWVDSCAEHDHPMIDSLWGERRAIGRVSVALRQPGRGLLFQLLRAGERWMDRRRAREQAIAQLIAEAGHG